MTIDHSTRRLHIPVRFVDGVWECEFGGNVPAKEGVQGELVVPRNSIEDKSFLAMMRRREIFKVLDEGTRLVVAVTIKHQHPPKGEFRHLLRDAQWARQNIAPGHFSYWSSGQTHFVEVELAGPDAKQARRYRSNRGGLWLMTEGVQAIGLASTTILLPREISFEPVASLNHAYTKLSETFEAWRISHTGNIYRHVFYQEENGQWYPLDVLRDRTLDRQDKAIAHNLWEAFMAKMAGDPSAPNRK